MRKMTLTILMAGVLAACLSVSRPSMAVSFEDSLDDCSYPKVFDVVVLRPLSFYSMLVGAALFVPVFPFAAITVWEDIGQIRYGLIGAAADFTFKRPLGECAGVTLAY